MIMEKNLKPVPVVPAVIAHIFLAKPAKKAPPPREPLRGVLAELAEFRCH
jgi:hypothetical protein